MPKALALLGGLIFSAALSAAEPYRPGRHLIAPFKDLAQGFIQQHCLECHDDESKKGNLSLTDLGPVDETNAALWKSIWAQVALRQMPPKKKEAPQVLDRLRFTEWILTELGQSLRDKGGFADHLDPKRGNFVDHELLFGPLPSGIELEPTSSPARLWRLTPQEHITRLNELINVEPPYQPARPGLRSHGDSVPTNHGGELKLYFGIDQILRVDGGTVAYATAVKGVPAVLSPPRKIGLKNYPTLTSVNSAESTQILGKAADILNFMAFGVRSLVSLPEQITNDPKSYDRVKPPGDIRGQPTSIVYSPKDKRPKTPMQDLMASEVLDEARLQAAVNHLFEALTFRPPTQQETQTYTALVRDSVAKVGRKDGVVMGLSAIFLDRDALFRPELVKAGRPDAHGRVMLRDWELGLALNHALGYLKPDPMLREAIVQGRMRSREDVQRELTRMLDDPSLRKPRLLQFFRDYFDYDLGGTICKDNKALTESGATNRGADHYAAMFDANASTERLIEIILQEDREVLRELLTTTRAVVTPKDAIYFGRRLDEGEVASAAAARRQQEAVLRRQEQAKLEALKAEVTRWQQTLKTQPDDRRAQQQLAAQQRLLASTEKEQKNAQRQRARNATQAQLVAPATLKGSPEFARVSRPSFGGGSMKPERQLVNLPADQRLGLLTHPSWLVSQSDAMDNHAIHRGIWIRERLLGGGIPDVPITVDAQLPAEPQHTLRERMRVTRKTYCWSCHQKMDPLGLPFEMYNHAGIYRRTELNQPVDSSGEIIDSGDPALDGPVANALEMIRKLAQSQRVEQVFVRHAFRFWMGRNETLNDAPVLQAAHQAYRQSGGSMKALLGSLLTSDAFLYRKPETNAPPR